MTYVLDALRRHPALWALRLLWVVLPFTVGSTIEAALESNSAAVRGVAGVGSWALWSAVLVGLLVRRPWGLTLARVAAAGPLLASLVAAVDDERSWLAIGHGAVVLAVALLPEVASDLVDGLSYGDERRLMLRAPFALYLGPIPLAWAATIAGVVTGPLLLAARQWVLGAVVTIAGAAAAWWGIRSLHQLARRWIVFVPNGFVIHDLMAAREPFLIRRQDVTTIGPAFADVDLSDDRLIDVSQHATGVVLQVDLNGEIEVVPRRRGVSEVRVVEHVLFTPTRPGAVLTEMRARRIPR